MNRDKILEKSRNENTDEGILTAQNRGRRIGIISFCIVFIFISIFGIFNELSIDAPMAMFWAYLAAEAYPLYKFTKKKAYFATVVAGSVASISALAIFIINTLG